MGILLHSTTLYFRYVTKQDCVTVMETYTFSYPPEFVTGTVLLTDVKQGITDPQSVFAVPTGCESATPYSVSANQIKSSVFELISSMAANP